MNKKQFEQRLKEATKEIQCLQMEFGSIFILQAMKANFEEDIKDYLKEDPEYPEENPDEGMAVSMKAYVVELEGTIQRLNAIEEQHNPGGREFVAKVDAELERLETV
jgi:hypothetical protein